MSANLVLGSVPDPIVIHRWTQGGSYLRGSSEQRRRAVSLECEREVVSQSMWEYLKLMESWEPLLWGSASEDFRT